MDKPPNRNKTVVHQPTHTNNVRKGFVLAFKYVFEVFKSALKRTAYDGEARQFYLASDISQMSAVVFLFALTIALFTISDYMLFEFTPLFFGLVALRLALIAYCGFQFMYLNRVKNYRSYDTSTLIYLLIVVLGTLLINFTRPENFVAHIIVIDMAVLVFYLVVPTRFIYQALPALVFSIGEVVLSLL
jgi:two-component system, sensor histidine kinase PdtaS